MIDIINTVPMDARQLAAQLVERARAEGIGLAGPDRLWTRSGQWMACDAGHWSYEDAGAAMNVIPCPMTASLATPRTIRM